MSVSLAYVVQAPKPYRGFSIGMPELVEAAPGELVTINGTILNFGWWWLHNFNLTATGLPENYAVTFSPQWFEHVRILREWNPEQGLYFVPEKFAMGIQVPENATGVFTVNVTGQEFMSWKQVSNSTAFIFRVSSPAKLSISDIVVPEEVTEFKEFNISFSVKNEGLTNQLVTLSVSAPADWNVTPEQSLMVNASSSADVFFALTPTNAGGEISVLLLYPYKAQILNMTKAGPMLIPQAPTALPTGLVAWFEQQLKALPSWILIVAVVFLAIIAWNLYKILKGYKFRIVRKKPEEMKKQIELPAANHLLQNFE
jgi:hypothetical protein